jgi:uncharacterized iron-regulated membrane protein
MAGFRRRLSGVHSWAGVVFGGLLFAVFWMGTLSVFDREIDRWMMPSTRLAAAPRLPSLDPLAAAVAPLIPAGARQWRIDLPTPRTPVLRFTAQRPGGPAVSQLLNPRDFAPLSDPATLGASGFFFPFHYGLLISWKELGKWMVGTAAMAMLVLLVAGVVIHRKLLADFFTFRPRKRLPRSTLDLHNVTGVIGLPFHFLITLSGLVIFFNMYFPLAYQGAFDAGAKGQSQFQSQSYGRYSRARAGTPGTLSSLDAMAAQAGREWGGGVPYFVRVWHPGDANSYVELRRSYAGEVTMNLDQLYFDAATGRLLQRFQAGPAMGVQRFLSGLHFVQFNHWPLRWLYFVLGLSGCLMIATGLVFWVEARPADARRTPKPGRRVVLGLCVGSVTGLFIATLAYLAANRLLPAEAGLAGSSRSGLEVSTFFLAWLACFGHAAWRGARAWREQVACIGVLACLCVAANAWTTGAYGAAAPPLPAAVWGVDLALLVSALAAAWVWRRLARGRVGTAKA